MSRGFASTTKIICHPHHLLYILTLFLLFNPPHHLHRFFAFVIHSFIQTHPSDRPPRMPRPSKHLPCCPSATRQKYSAYRTYLQYLRTPDMAQSPVPFDTADTPGGSPCGRSHTRFVEIDKKVAPKVPSILPFACAIARMNELIAVSRRSVSSAPSSYEIIPLTKSDFIIRSKRCTQC